MTTLQRITAAIQVLTADDHLPEPGTVIVSKDNHVTIMPEMPGAPISGLIVWAWHLEGDVTYEAEILFPGPNPATGIIAKGKIDGIDVQILSSTTRVLQKLMKHRVMEKVSVTEMDLRELASEENVLGTIT